MVRRDPGSFGDLGEWHTSPAGLATDSKNLGIGEAKEQDALGRIKVTTNGAEPSRRGGI